MIVFDPSPVHLCLFRPLLGALMPAAKQSLPQSMKNTYELGVWQWSSHSFKCSLSPILVHSFISQIQIQIKWLAICNGCTMYNCTWRWLTGEMTLPFFIASNNTAALVPKPAKAELDRGQPSWYKWIFGCFRHAGDLGNLVAPRYGPTSVYIIGRFIY
jgi:hypothetical protein